MLMVSRTTRRAGFTLVELMVSAAVCLIIMTVLATVFQSGIDSMRELRSVGSLQDQLRAATEMIRRDLQTDHFVKRDPVNGQQRSGARLSEQWLTDGNWPAPAGGFFLVESDSSWSTSTADLDLLNLPQEANAGAPNKGQNFRLHFTSILPGDKAQNMYSTDAGGALSSPAAEIQYFVDTTTIPTNFRLIRRQRLVARTDLDRATFLGRDTAGEVVAGTSSSVFTLSNIAQSANRMTARSMLTSAGRVGDDVLLSNVKLFEVKANWEGPGAPNAASNTDFPFDFVSASGSNVFDTGNGQNANTASPGGGTADQRIRLKALQIRIRIYDPQLQTTRQVTIIQDM